MGIWKLTTLIFSGIVKKMCMFWDNVRSVINDFLGNDIPRTSPVIYLGNIYDDVMGCDCYLIQMLLAASKKPTKLD